jgi:hypothetical protein
VRRINICFVICCVAGEDLIKDIADRDGIETGEMRFEEGGQCVIYPLLDKKMLLPHIAPLSYPLDLLIFCSLISFIGHSSSFFLFFSLSLAQSQEEQTN